ncbi:transcriptional regulator [Blastococcus sp. TF02-8]|nr:transcriptional regulator [Blastococcus sp. TF02-8]
MLRWAAVAALVLVLATLPAALATRSADDSPVSAADLRQAVLASGSVPFSGVAQSAGGLALPVSDQLTSVADLFSDRTTMRVWWRGPQESRVDVVTPAGETGTYLDATGTWTWEFESATATRAARTPFALPAPPDLLPGPLARRLLSEAADEELSRSGARRVAGRDALGLRLTPSSAAASVEHVDVWVDADTGLPLEVQVVGPDGPPALDSRMLEVDLTAPSADVVAFTPPVGATVREGREAEAVLQEGSRIRPVPLPVVLADLPRRSLDGAPSGIGLYGSGVTLLAVAPVPERLAGALRDLLRASPGAVVDEAGVRTAAGPVGLMLVELPGRRPYVLTGTVTVDALARAAAQLPGAGEGR